MIDLASAVESTTVPGFGNLRTPHLAPQLCTHYQQPIWGCGDDILRVGQIVDRVKASCSDEEDVQFESNSHI